MDNAHIRSVSRRKDSTTTMKNEIPRVTYAADNVNAAFDPELRKEEHQARSDWGQYLGSRPDELRRSAENPDEKMYKSTLAETSWDGKGLIELAKMARDARLRGDKTTFEDVQDVLADRLQELGERENEERWSDDAINATIDRLDRIMNGPEVTGSVSKAVSSAENIARENAHKLVKGGHMRLEDADEYVRNETVRISEDSKELNSPTVFPEQGGMGGDMIQQAAALMSEASAALNNPNIAPEDKQQVLGVVQEALNNLKTAEGGAGVSQDIPSSPNSPEAASVENTKEEGKEDPRDSIETRLETHMRQNHQEDLNEYSEARRSFLEIAAKSQKGHWRRIRPGGKTERILRTLPGVGHKLADYFTKPTKAETEAGDAYEAALAKIDTAQRIFLSNEEIKQRSR